MAFIRWRKSKGYKVRPFKRPFWVRKLWQRSDEARRIKMLCRRIFAV